MNCMHVLSLVPGLGYKRPKCHHIGSIVSLLFHMINASYDHLQHIATTDDVMAHHLLNLPHEVLHSIISNADPQDLAALCCCRALNDFVKNNDLLHKEIYLNKFVRQLLIIFPIHTKMILLYRIQYHRMEALSGGPSYESWSTFKRS